jgi:hypothetical protein
MIQVLSSKRLGREKFKEVATGFNSDNFIMQGMFTV